MPTQGERISGKVHTYSEAVDTGVLICRDNIKYLFSKKEWLSEIAPKGDLRVTFTTNNSQAKSILIDTGSENP